jgi:hypothetical protein
MGEHGRCRRRWFRPLDARVPRDPNRRLHQQLSELALVCAWVFVALAIWAPVVEVLRLILDGAAAFCFVQCGWHCGWLYRDRER